MSINRLIRPLPVDIARIDTVATEAVGYDPVFRAPVPVAPHGARGDVRSARGEHPVVRLMAQIEMQNQDMQRMAPMGNVPAGMMTLIVHIRELRQKSLLNADGTVLLLNSRLVTVYDKAGQLEKTYPDPPGMYCTEVRDLGHGISGKRNLVALTYKPRSQGTPP